MRTDTIALLLIILLMMSSCTFHSRKSDRGSEKGSTSETSSIVDDRIIEEGNRFFNGEETNKQPAIISDFSSMDEIISQYEKNEIRAEKSYAGKRYQLTGRVSRIGSDLGSYVIIDGNNDNAFWFYLLSSEESKAENLSKGEMITISGVLENYIGLLEGAALMFHQSRFESPSDSGDNNILSQGDVPKDEIMAVINTWNVMHNTYNPNMADMVYAPKVLYYWSDYSTEKIKTSKAGLFDKNPEFQQSLSDFDLHYLDEYRVRADFTKSVKTSPSSVVKDYDSYVVLEKISGIWKVVEESDLTTDKNMAKKLLGGMKKIAEKDFLTIYSKVEKKATDVDDTDCLSLYLFNNKTKKRHLLFTTGYENKKIATNIRVLNSSGTVTIPSIGSVEIVSDDKVLISTEDTPYASVYLYDLNKKGCYALSDAYGEIGLTVYNGIPAIAITNSAVSENGRYIYEIYYDFNGNELGKGKPVSLQ